MRRITECVKQQLARVLVLTSSEAAEDQGCRDQQQQQPPSTIINVHIKIVITPEKKNAYFNFEFSQHSFTILLKI